MVKEGDNNILSDWSKEINKALEQSNMLCIAIFDLSGSLLFANPLMTSFFEGEPSQSLINPTFERIREASEKQYLVFDGFLTLGDYASICVSIEAKIYRKNEKLFIIGGVDMEQMLEQNKTILLLNREINSLQRKLIKENKTLDITLKKLSKANDELKELNATKDKFFSIIAHDLKNPFSSILGFADLLATSAQKTRNEDKTSYYIDIIRKSAENAYKLLENLLEWSRSQTGRIQYIPLDLNINKLIDEAILLHKQIADNKMIKLQSNTNNSHVIFADKNTINTVLRNLISNALKFTPKGGSVTVNTKETIYNQNDYIEISICDTGVGMPNDRVEKLFRIDQSVSTNGTEKEQGTGIGLILCKEFIEKNKGKIWVESTPEVGSTFRFILPKSDKKSDKDYELKHVIDNKNANKIAAVIKQTNEFNNSELLNKLLASYHKANKSLSISDIKLFALQLDVFGKQYSITEFISLAQELQDNLETFNIGNIQLYLSQFKTFLQHF